MNGSEDDGNDPCSTLFVPLQSDLYLLVPTILGSDEASADQGQNEISFAQVSVDLIFPVRSKWDLLILPDGNFARIDERAQMLLQLGAEFLIGMAIADKHFDADFGCCGQHARRVPLSFGSVSTVLQS